MSILNVGFVLNSKRKLPIHAKEFRWAMGQTEISTWPDSLLRRAAPKDEEPSQSISSASKEGDCFPSWQRGESESCQSKEENTTQQRYRYVFTCVRLHSENLRCLLLVDAQT